MVRKDEQLAAKIIAINTNLGFARVHAQQLEQRWKLSLSYDQREMIYGRDPARKISEWAVKFLDFSPWVIQNLKLPQDEGRWVIPSKAEFYNRAISMFHEFVMPREGSQTDLWFQRGELVAGRAHQVVYTQRRQLWRARWETYLLVQMTRLWEQELVQQGDMEPDQLISTELLTYMKTLVGLSIRVPLESELVPMSPEDQFKLKMRLKGYRLVGRAAPLRRDSGSPDVEPEVK